MADDLPSLFASKRRAVVIASAGCGKTELIARAVACQDNGQQLVLTHTHAGVRSLRDKFQKNGVPSRLYDVDTIDGFARKYAASFPKSSGYDEQLLIAQDWDKIREAGAKILSSSVGWEIIQVSYSGLYVDEYQDCTMAQHRLIMNLADILPCRIVGDPLQGIFDFGDNVLVNWFREVFPFFERLDGPRIPWRWKNAGNEALGDWLWLVRDCLKSGKSIDLRPNHVPVSVNWLQLSPQNQQSVLFNALRNKQGTIVAMHRLPRQAHKIASKLNGAFTSMEEVESKDLLKWSDTIEQSNGADRAIAIIDFASQCMTKISSELKTIRARLESGEQNLVQGIKKHVDVASALAAVASSDDLNPILGALVHIESVRGCALYRHELWYDMKKAIREFGSRQYSTLRDASWAVRDRGRIWGRSVASRTISRVLLVKGLEFDHAIVLDADQLNAKELYVAMTRGSKSLTVLSGSPILLNPPPDFKK